MCRVSLSSVLLYNRRSKALLPLAFLAILFNFTLPLLLVPDLRMGVSSSSSSS